MRLPLLPAEGCCRRCGRAAPGLDREFLCEDCRGRDAPHFDRAASAMRFEGEARRMIHAFKFRGGFWLREDFADILEGMARARFRVEEIDFVSPVPMTILHRIMRGHAQSDCLAAALARRLGRPLVRRALKRIGNPKAQRTLGGKERRENVRGTFAVRRPLAVRGKTILVVDDVMTTGATLSECARVLKEAGASRVWCISLARSLRD